jgi:TonB family protein
MNLSQGVIGFVDSVGAVLVHFVWQGALLALIYAVGRPFFTRMASRYRFGLGVLIVMALCPVATFAFLCGSSAPTASVAAAMPAIRAGVVAVAGHAVDNWQFKALLPWLVGVWLIGVMILATRSLWQWRRLVRIVREAAAPPAEWAQRLAALRERFGVRRPVRLLCSARAVTPMLIGWLRPIVLLPASMMSGFTTAQIELIIAHELGHICRWDYVANLFQVVLETVLFYHPAVHWISHDVRNARESCCDELVLELAQGNPLAYARTLADLEELRHDEGLLVPALGASGGVLLARIRHIVGVSETNERMPRTQTWPIVLIAIAVALLVWRPHSSTPLPKAENIAASLAKAPQAALAVVMGHPELLQKAAPTTVESKVPAPAKAEPVRDEIVAPPPSITIDRPRVGVAKLERMTPVRETFALAKTAPSLDIAEPEATGLTTPEASEVSPSIEPVRIVSPVYPQRAKLAGIEGNVKLEFGIAADGTVSDIKVVGATPAGVFDTAAIAALKQWHFANSSDHRYVRDFVFTLQHDSTEERCVTPTGTMICRRPADYMPNRTIINERH